MKVFAAAFPFLIVATAFGSQVQALHEPMVAIRPHETSIHLQGLHHPSDCCTQYTPRKIRCGFMKDYYETSSGCSQPAVIFLTKKGQRVCANPFDLGVQNCVRSLKSN
ncbi:C-C motif chemokine 15-like isoform X2 [Neofelis nebulosa]|uniref:C-C motif chemokine 15-like isoform X2 n=1 Tax=Neofelis nebulosa TaxID=61452 RepID=UPI0027298EB0|nr:C-C motif chemokine 15-like isoform X2 [Neofelis nebulosa]